jgi:asparagine synthase (glutamine-hydrolysing)
MTALAGFWHPEGRPGAGDSCRRMLGSQRAYGPHGEAVWSDGTIAMGRCLHRTLPEDSFDRQPLHGAGGRLTLVADVRLDNRDELAEALRIDNAARLSDAAILLAALERWEEDALDRLIGDFAFALWDAERRTLTLARDFLGQRPLHYHCGKDVFAFASMPKGLHALPDIAYAPDEQAVAEFMTMLPAAGSRSFFEGVERVEPGHVATVTAGGVVSRRYWRPSRATLHARADDYVEGLRHHLDQATRARLRTVSGAVGSHLSAGLDSSAVTATAARAGGALVAFTSVPREGYDGRAPDNRLGDEGPLAAATAALYPGIEHALVRGGERSPLDDLDRNFYLFDQPSLNPCNMVWATGIASAARDRRLGVMLTGQMGNVSLSYNGIERLPELLGSGRLLALSRELSKLVSRGTMSWKGAAVATLGAYMPGGLWQWLAERRGNAVDLASYSAIRAERLRELDVPGLARERGLDLSYRPWKKGFDARVWMLERIDPGNSNKGFLGGWGIDHRDPTADRRLVEYCLSVPMEQFLRDGVPRSLAVRALGDRLPEAVLRERRKGYQAVDWHEALSAARGTVTEEIERLAPCPPAARALDLDRLRKLARSWPEGGWEKPEVMQAYRLALLRGLSAGHFLRKATGSNQ